MAITPSAPPHCAGHIVQPQDTPQQRIADIVALPLFDGNVNSALPLYGGNLNIA
jgi:hypothetical protein